MFMIFNELIILFLLLLELLIAKTIIPKFGVFIAIKEYKFILKRTRSKLSNTNSIFKNIL